MGRKYLDDIGVVDRVDFESADDHRNSKWEASREIYGFDERETWVLDYAFYCWLYERLMMFKEIACINLEYHKFEFKGESLSQGQCIDRIIEALKTRLTKYDTDMTEKDYEALDDAVELWRIIISYMWW